MNKFTRVERIDGTKKFRCTCECGGEIVLFKSELPLRISCGCRSVTKRGVQGEVLTIGGKRVASPEYRSWQLMKNRTTNPQCADWKYYVGKGVTLHPPWHDFTAFLADMGRKPTTAHTLDRIDGAGGYSPENCRWSTRKEQARNRDYASVRAWEVAEALGLSPQTVYHMMWEVREKDKGNTRHFSLSPKNKARIRAYMKG